MEKVTLTPKVIGKPEATTLDSQILNAYKEGIFNPRNSYDERVFDVLNIFQDREGDLAGSNCFAPIALREFLPAGTRLATMADLGRATEINPGFLKGFYSDTGLILRTAGDPYAPNDFLAKQLAHELGKRGMSLREGIPKIIYFDALDLSQNKNLAYGLIYVLNEKAESGKNIIDAPELTKNFKFKTMTEEGIPIEDKNENRDYYRRKNGLSRFCLGRGSGVVSDGGLLAYSDDNGKVVVVNAEGTSQKIEQKAKNPKSR